MYSSSSFENNNNDNKPRAHLNAYSIFFQAERQRILLSKNAEQGFPPVQNAGHDKISFNTLARRVSAEWKRSDQNTKDFYEHLAQQDKYRYNVEMDRWLESQRRLQEQAYQESQRKSYMESFRPLYPPQALPQYRAYDENQQPPYFNKEASTQSSDRQSSNQHCASLKDMTFIDKKSANSGFNHSTAKLEEFEPTTSATQPSKSSQELTSLLVHLFDSVCTQDDNPFEPVPLDESKPKAIVKSLTGEASVVSREVVQPTGVAQMPRQKEVTQPSTRNDGTLEWAGFSDKSEDAFRKLRRSKATFGAKAYGFCLPEDL